MAGENAINGPLRVREKIRGISQMEVDGLCTLRDHTSGRT